MLELASGLSPRALTALADLERRTVAVDGGRLKLEWGVLKSRDGRRVEDLLWWEGEELLGFLGLYAFGPPDVELAGMVDPAARRRGIATALLNAALPLCRERGYGQALLVTPRESEGGQAFAISRGARLEHSEHALTLFGPPTPGPEDAATTMRRATVADAAEISRLLTSAFGWTPPDTAERLASQTERTLLIEVAGSAIGTVRLTSEQDTGSIYGFAIDPGWQGRGIGRDVLRRICSLLIDEGAKRVRLEVAVDNERALGLYTSIGFERVTTEDYFALPISPPAPDVLSP